MLTNTPKQGDTVYITETRRYESNGKDILVEKVGKKYLYALGEKFDFTGKHISDFPSYVLWDNEQAYIDCVQRRKSITEIKNFTYQPDFGKGLSNETLDQILMMLNPKNQS